MGGIVKDGELGKRGGRGLSRMGRQLDDGRHRQGWRIVEERRGLSIKPVHRKPKKNTGTKMVDFVTFFFFFFVNFKTRKIKIAFVPQTFLKPLFGDKGQNFQLKSSIYIFLSLFLTGV